MQRKTHLIGDSGRVDTGGEAIGAGAAISVFGACDTGIEPKFAVTFDSKVGLSTGLIPTVLALRRVVGIENFPLMGRGNLSGALARTLEALGPEEEARADELPVGLAGVAVEGSRSLE